MIGRDRRSRLHNVEIGLQRGQRLHRPPGVIHLLRAVHVPEDRCPPRRSRSGGAGRRPWMLRCRPPGLRRQQPWPARPRGRWRPSCARQQATPPSRAWPARQGGAGRPANFSKSSACGSGVPSSSARFASTRSRARPAEAPRRWPQGEREPPLNVAVLLRVGGQFALGEGAGFPATVEGCVSRRRPTIASASTSSIG